MLIQVLALTASPARPSRFCTAVSSATAEIEGFRRRRRAREQFAARHEAVFLQHPVLVPNRDVLPELAQRNAQRDLAAKSVAIGPHMAEHRNALMRAKSGCNLREAGVRFTR